MSAVRCGVSRSATAAIAAVLATVAAGQVESAARGASRPSAAASRPVESDPAVLFRPATRPHRDGSKPWTWPSNDAFAVRSDVARLRPRPLWTARAKVLGTEGRLRDPFDLVLFNAADRDETVKSRVAAARGGVGPGPDLSDDLSHARGEALPTGGAPPPEHAMSVRDYRLAFDLSCAAVVAESVAAPCAAHAALFGYVAALLDDSPGDPELPEAQCSMDVGPARAAAKFAAAAAAEGALGRFLRLRLMILGDRFERMIYSNYGDAAQAVEAAELVRAPVDLAALFAGLVLQFDDASARAVEIGAERLGRAVAESSVADRMESWLIATAADDRVDGHNRLRAAQTLFFVYAHEPGRAPLAYGSARTRDVGYVRAKMRGLRLSRPAKIWLGQPD